MKSTDNFLMGQQDAVTVDLNAMVSSTETNT